MDLALESNDHIIKSGDGVILKRDAYLKYVKAIPGRRERMANLNFFLDAMIGREYGRTYEVQASKLVNIDPFKYEDEDVTYEGDQETRDNRSINDDSRSQKMSRDEIMKLKSEGVGGDEIVERIADSSATFKEKTVYSKAKYLKKKKKKHLTFFTTYKPTARLLCELYFTKAPSKILELRPDTLAQILTWSDAKYGSKMLVAETCQGLILGALLERLGGHGILVHAFNGNCPVRIILNQFNLSEDEKTNILCGFAFESLEGIKSTLAKGYSDSEKTRETGSKVVSSEERDGASQKTHEPDDKVMSGEEKERADRESCMEKEKDSANSVHVPTETAEPKEQKVHDESTDKTVTSIAESNVPCNKYYTKEKREAEEKMAITHLAKKDLDALIIATKFNPLGILKEMIDFIRPSGPIVIYCQYREPLLLCYNYLKSASLAVNVQLTETWFREMQVLKDRTHPKNTMSGRSGYLLRGIKVVQPEDESTDNIEPESKVPKLE